MCVNYTYKSYIRIITYHSIHVTFNHLSGVYSFFRSDLRWRLSYPKLGKGSWLPNTSRCAPSDQLSSHTSGNSQTFRTSSEKKLKWLLIRQLGILKACQTIEMKWSWHTAHQLDGAHWRNELCLLVPRSIGLAQTGAASTLTVPSQYPQHVPRRTRSAVVSLGATSLAVRQVLHPGKKSKTAINAFDMLLENASIKLMFKQQGQRFY